MTLRTKEHRPLTWNAERRGLTPDYQYTCIKAIFDDTGPEICNIYGVVIDLKEVSRSRGSDFFLLIVIVDSTTKTPLKVRLFHKDDSYFPKVTCGDIIRLHRLHIYNQLEGPSLVSKKGWSWLLWKYQNINNPVLKEESSSASYTLLKSDLETVKSLQTWQKQFGDITQDWVAQVHKSIFEIRHDDHFNLSCEVVDITEDDGYWCARVWDGTKPEIMFHQNLIDNLDRNNNKGLPEEYLVDIMIANDHHEKCKSDGITEGTLITFTGLHAFPNPRFEANASGKRCSELNLYEGNWNGRGIKICDQHDENFQRLKSNLDLMRQEIAQDAPAPSSTFDIMKRMDDGVDDDNPSPAKIPRLQESKNEHSDPFDLEPPTIDEVPDSATVISGVAVPHQLSTIKSMVDEEVPVSQSKSFRVKCRVKAVSTAKAVWVGHYSPNTTIYFPSKNDGEPLKITKPVEKFVTSWRKASGKSDVPNVTTAKPDSQLVRPWKLPFDNGYKVTIKVQESCVSAKDRSHWDGMEIDGGDFLIRRRIMDGQEFSILYILKPTDYSKEGLLKYKSSYDRVVRILPLDVRTSNAPPAVGIQDGVFYYCCPANAKPTSIPSLQQEADRFNISRISRVAGSPMLIPRFDISIAVGDDNDSVDTLCIVGTNATTLFRGLTAQAFLANVDKWSGRLEKALLDLIEQNMTVHCVIEKKSRKKLDDVTRTYVYEIRDTALKEDLLDGV